MMKLTSLLLAMCLMAAPPSSGPARTRGPRALPAASRPSISLEEAKRLGELGKEKLESLPEPEQESSPRYYKAVIGKKECGWASIECDVKPFAASSQPAEGPNRESRKYMQINVDTVIAFPKLRVHGQASMRVSRYFSLLGADFLRVRMPAEGATERTVDSFSAHGKKIKLTHNVDGRPEEHEVDRSEHGSVIMCEQLIEALKLKDREQCILVEIDPQTAKVSASLFRATALRKGGTLVQVYRITDKLELQRANAYILDVHGRVIESSESISPVRLVAVDKSEFAKLQKEFPVDAPKK